MRVFDRPSQCNSAHTQESVDRDFTYRGAFFRAEVEAPMFDTGTREFCGAKLASRLASCRGSHRGVRWASRNVLAQGPRRRALLAAAFRGGGGDHQERSRDTLPGAGPNLQASDFRRTPRIAKPSLAVVPPGVKPCPGRNFTWDAHSAPIMVASQQYAIIMCEMRKKNKWSGNAHSEVIL